MIEHCLLCKLSHFTV